jgi:hypothetical protein
MWNGFSAFLGGNPSASIVFVSNSLPFSDPGPERGDLPDDFVPITISEQFLRHPSIGLGNTGCYTCRASNQHASITKGICIEGLKGGQNGTNLPIWHYVLLHILLQ